MSSSASSSVPPEPYAAPSPLPSADPVRLAVNVVSGWYDEGFRAGLIGALEQTAERVVAYRQLGVGLALLGFPHCLEEVEHSGRRVLPPAREPEAALPEREPATAPV